MQMKLFTVLVAATLGWGCGGDGNHNPTGGAGGIGGAAGIGGMGASGGTGGESTSTAWPCTEEGIRDAVAAEGGPHTFACDGPTTVTTADVIELRGEVILDGEGNLTLDGQGDHKLFFIWANANAVLRGMTITGGGGSLSGAGISSAGVLRVEECEIVGNRSGDIGGGIYTSMGSLEVVDSRMADNEATYGGGIFSAGDARITDSIIADNAGGGLVGFSSLQVIRSEITGNESAFNGGGISSRGDLLVNLSTISSNRAMLGGGIASSGRASLFETTIDGNTAEEGGGVYMFDASRWVQGGDLFIDQFGVLDLVSSTISNNAALRGAGVYTTALRNSVWNSTISGNIAEEEGGAFYVGGTSLGASTHFFSHNTISNNTAPFGSAIFATGETPTLRFSGNIVSGTCEADGPAVALVSEGSNVESPGDTCTLDHLDDQVGVSDEALALDPLADNGGETRTHMPRNGSVVINAVPVDRCEVLLPIDPLLDQRRVDRPQGDGCDAGSVEVDAPLP